MASQWVINNKKVKDWTIGGKKVKSITLANGKVLNFGTIAPSIPTIKASDYEVIGLASSALSYAIGFKQLKVIGKPDATKPLILEIDNIIGSDTFSITPTSRKILIEAFGGFYELTGQFDERVWFISYTTETTKTITFRKGHKYQFESGKDPVDLGTY